MRGLILEGIGAAGKTSTLAALRQRLAASPERECSLVALTEAYTQVLNVVDGEHVKLAQADHLALLQKQVGLLENLQQSVRWQGEQTRRSRGLMFLLERVHLSHRVTFCEAENPDATALEQRLSQLNAKCVLLTVSAQCLEDRTVLRRGLSFASISAKNEHLQQNALWQEQLRQQAKHSLLPTLEISTDAMDWLAVADEALAFLDAN